MYRYWACVGKGFVARRAGGGLALGAAVAGYGGLIVAGGVTPPSVLRPAASPFALREHGEGGMGGHLSGAGAPSGRTSAMTA